jgi:hypothetical protein
MAKEHTCLGGVRSTEPSWWEKDAQNIPLARVCVKCKAEKLSKFTRKTITGYDQRDIDEPIDESP